MSEYQKVVFAGLDNSGKTSFLEMFQNNFNIIITKPTIGIERKRIDHMKWMGLHLATWDLGGQRKFRKEYLENPSVFENIKILFYLIDIQKKKRFEEALDYYSKIVGKLKEVNSKTQIAICFHKFDPNLADESKLLAFRKDLVGKLKELTNSFSVKVFNTTIYDHSTIIKALSESIIRNHSTGKLIDGYLKQFAKLTFASATVLLDKHTLVVGSQYSNKKYLSFCEYIISWVNMAMDKILRYDIKLEDMVSNVILQETNENARVFVEKFMVMEKFQFLIVVLTRNKGTSTLINEHLPNLIEQLKTLIQVD